ncbi:MAG: LruC domain-containing protein [Prevotella sp.]|nr:LruC domain-containing protein [Prevotella sp.]
MNRNAKLLIGLACLSLGLTACKEDYFDPEAYQAIVKDAFPVSNISPDQDWAIFGTATANVSVNGDYGEQYRVAVYKENPLFTSPVTQLASVTVKSGERAQLSFTYELATPTVYFTCYDKLNRKVVQAANIGSDGTVEMNFFGSAAGVRTTRATEAEAPDYAKTYEDYLNPVFEKKNSWDPDVTVNQISIDGMKAYEAITDADLASNNTPTNVQTQWVAKTYTIPEGFSGTSVDTGFGLLTLASGGGTAGTTCTLTLNNSEVSDPAGFFTHDTTGDAKFNFNNKFNGATYDGVTYTHGLKMEGTTKILFTTASTSSVTIVQSTWSANTIKFDGTELAVSSATEGTGYRVYTINDVAAGEHNITRGSGESGLFCVKVMMSSGNSVAVADNSLSWAGMSACISRPSYSFTPIVNGKLIFYHKQNGSKNAVTIKDGESYYQMNNQDLHNWSWDNPNIEFDVQAGHTYTLYLASDDAFYGLQLGYNAVVGPGDGKHFRVAAGATINKVFNLNATYGVYNDVVLYVEGTVHLNGNTLNGPTIVVANGGKVIIDGNTNMSNAGRFVVLAGGTIEGSDGVTFNVNNGSPSYNAGTISFKGELNINGCDFYNCGTVSVKTLRNTSQGKITNFGSIEAENNCDAADAYNCDFINGCYMHYSDHAGIGHLIMLQNSRLEVDGVCEFNQSWNAGFDASTPEKVLAYEPANPNILMDKSVIKVGTAYVTNTVFQGPSNSGEFAIVKMGKVAVGNGTDLMQRQNCYFDWNVNELYSKNAETHTAGTKDTQNVDFYKGHLLKFVTESTAPGQFSVPKGDCTGIGYNGDPTTPVEEDDTTIPSYRYCFEDNFPQPGDYDFNDCVITVKPKVTDNVVELTVSLDAVGATKTIAAALRVKGLTMTSHVDISIVGDDFDEGLPNNILTFIGDYKTQSGNNVTAVQNWKGLTILTSAGRGSDAGNDFVMRLFNDAHYAISYNGTKGQNRFSRWFYNTLDSSQAEDYPYADNVYSRTIKYTFEFANNQSGRDYANKFVQENFDVFIVESHSGITWEVHTYPFKWDEVLSAYSSGNKLSSFRYANGVSGATSAIENYPWAICVPGDFKYPLEWKSICGNSTVSNVTMGQSEEVPYPNFEAWAQLSEGAKAQASDAVKKWYENYNSSVVWNATYNITAARPAR